MKLRVVKVTRNFQVSIPRDLAESLDVRVGDRLAVRVEDGKLIFEKFSAVRSLAGALNPGFKPEGLAEQLDQERKKGSVEGLLRF